MKPKTFNFTTKKINTVKDLRNWCDWLIEAGYEDGDVGVNDEFWLSYFNTTKVSLEGDKTLVDLIR